MNFARYGGRTFLLTVGCGVVTSVMRWFDKLDNGSFVAVIMASVCAYIAKSGWDEHSKVRADVQKTIAAKQADAPPPTTVDQVPQ
jgi:hypothetical protein